MSTYIFCTISWSNFQVLFFFFKVVGGGGARRFDHMLSWLSSVILAIMLWCVQFSHECSFHGLLGFNILKSK
jgi:hypothetical protein